MKKFIRLLNFEFNRFFKFFSAALFFIFTGQSILFTEALLRKNQQLQYAIQQTGGNESQINQMISLPLTMKSFLESFWYRLLVYSILAFLFFYLIFNWYRDWLGKNTFIYRLLMLPINRMQIFWAKSLILVIGALAYIAFQYCSVGFYQMIARWLLPHEYFTSLPIHEILEEATAYMGFPPTKALQIFLIIGACFVVLTHFTAAIMIERSLRLKGIIIGVFYCGTMYILQLLPLILNFSLLSSEVFLMTVACFILSWTISLAVIYYLLNHKVSV